MTSRCDWKPTHSDTVQRRRNSGSRRAAYLSGDGCGRLVDNGFRHGTVHPREPGITGRTSEPRAVAGHDETDADSWGWELGAWGANRGIEGGPVFHPRRRQ